MPDKESVESETDSSTSEILIDILKKTIQSPNLKLISCVDFSHKPDGFLKLKRYVLGQINAGELIHIPNLGSVKVSIEYVEASISASVIFEDKDFSLKIEHLYEFGLWYMLIRTFCCTKTFLQYVFDTKSQNAYIVITHFSHEEIIGKSISFEWNDFYQVHLLRIRKLWNLPIISVGTTSIDKRATLLTNASAIQIINIPRAKKV